MFHGAEFHATGRGSGASGRAYGSGVEMKQRGSKRERTGNFAFGADRLANIIILR